MSQRVLRLMSVISALFVLAAFSSAVRAQQATAPPTAAASPTVVKEEKPPRWPDYKKVVEGMEKVSTTGETPLFTLWRYPRMTPAAKSPHNQETLLCEIPEAMLGKKFMLTTSFSGGDMYGFPLDEQVVQWEIRGNNVILVKPQTRFLTGTGSKVDPAVKRSNPDLIRVVAPIMTMNDGNPVFDLGALLKSSLPDVSWMGGAINADLSTLAKVKAFPRNIEISANLVQPNMFEPNTLTETGVHFSFWSFPESDYKPREADDRVGYFLTTHQDWNAPTDSRHMFRRYVNRWHLEKRDPTLAICEPKEPIVFYLESTIPVQYRRAIRDGILAWNEAFREIGFDNAIVVRQQEGDNEYAALDPEDIRYSFIRWIVTGWAFAMGPSQANPFTGQIYNSDIIIDGSFVRAFEHQGQTEGLMAYASRRMGDPGLELFFKEHPEWLPADRASKSQLQFDDVPGQRAAALHARHPHMHRFGCCNLSHGMTQQMAFAGTMLADVPAATRERFIYELMRELVMHEVGHGLGLRHNFKGSSIYSLDEINRRRGTGEALTGSVMDYLPPLLYGEKLGEGAFVTSCVGPYDHWAIRYGYQPFDNSTKKGPDGKEFPGEREMLLGIASLSAKPEHAYATDEDTSIFGIDPMTALYDMGNDPLAWAQQRIALIDKRIGTLLEWSVKDGESWAYARSALISLWFEKAGVLDYVGRLVGGQSFNRSHRGDPNAATPYVMIDVARQRAALKMLEDTIFSPDYFAVSPNVLLHMSPQRWWHSGVSLDLNLEMPIRDWISMLQWWNLFDRLFPGFLQRVYDAELKSNDPNKLTLAEYLRDIQRACWKDALNGGEAKKGDWSKKPFIHDNRRSLQREYLGLMSNLVMYYPGDMMSPDVQAMVKESLRDLAREIDAVLNDTAVADKIDFASRAHLNDSRIRIRQILDPKFQERRGWMSSSFFVNGTAQPATK